MSFVMHKHGINMHVLPSFIQIFYTWLLMQNSLFIHFKLIIPQIRKFFVCVFFFFLKKTFFFFFFFLFL